MPSGFAHPPRPFVFRMRHLDGLHLCAETAFEIGFHLFLPDLAILPELTETFAEAARRGFGPQRSRSKLSSVTSPPCVSLTFEPPNRTVEAIRIDFLSPTELKESGDVVGEPNFNILFRRIRARIATLRALYGSGAAAN